MTISERQDQVDYIWQSSFQYELNEELRRILQEGALIGTQTTLEACLLEELNEEIDFKPFERLAGGAKPAEQAPQSPWTGCEGGETGRF